MIIFMILLGMVITPQAKVQDTEIYKLAEEYVGLEGDCYVMATKFLRDYYDEDDYIIRRATMTKVDYEDAKPGDVIFYERSTLGTTHWAIYLGDGLAFQGNTEINGVGRVVIDSVFLGEGATDPIFFTAGRTETVTFDFSLISLTVD